MARHCSGAVILGFSQSIAERVIVKPNTANEHKINKLKMPTPWNHLEAGIFFHSGCRLWCLGKMAYPEEYLTMA